MIKDALKAAKGQLATIPTLRYVSEDWGQLDFYDQLSVQFPCALIECQEVGYIDNSLNIQQAQAIISIRVSDLRPTNSSEINSDNEFDMFDLLSDVNKVLHGLKGVDFSPLTRIGMTRERRKDAIREFCITYRFNYTDRSGAYITQKLENIKPSINM